MVGIKVISIICSIVLFWGNSRADATKLGRLVGPQKVGKSDSGIYGPKYNEMKAAMEEFVGNNPEYAKIVSLGKSEAGVVTQGILIGKRGEHVKQLALVTGATHGNEYLNIVDRLPAAFLDKKNTQFFDYYNNGGVILVVPIFNPDGYDKKRRANTNWVDLNRDFTNFETNTVRFTQAETKNISTWVDGFIEKHSADFAFSMDYHCCYRGSLLFPWAYTKEPILPADRAAFDIIGKMMQKQFPGAKYGATSEIIWYLADGVSKDFWYAKYGALAVTYEGRYRTEKDKLSDHIAWWKGIVDYIQKK